MLYLCMSSLISCICCRESVHNHKYGFEGVGLSVARVLGQMVVLLVIELLVIKLPWIKVTSHTKFGPQYRSIGSNTQHILKVNTK